MLSSNLRSLIIICLRLEVEKHRTRRSCWTIIGQTVYDITDFLDKHPGGASVLLQYAGNDATKAFESIHEADLITRHLGQEYGQP
jgi:L-lactate dehydrogenase (cytochrome)